VILNTAVVISTTGDDHIIKEEFYKRPVFVAEPVMTKVVDANHLGLMVSVSTCVEPTKLAHYLGVTVRVPVEASILIDSTARLTLYFATSLRWRASLASARSL